MHGLPSAVVAVLLLAACGSTDGAATTTTAEGPPSATTTTVPAVATPAWAVPIVEYTRGWFDAASEGDVARLYPFFDRNAVVWSDTTTPLAIEQMAGTRQLLTALQQMTNDTMPTRSPSLLFVSWLPPSPEAPNEPGFSVLGPHVATYDECSEGPCRVIELASILGRGDVIIELLMSTLVADIRLDPLDRIVEERRVEIGPLLDAAEDRYYELAAALSAHDVDRILATDDLEPDPGDVEAVEATASGLAAAFETWPEMRAEPLTLADVGLRNASDPVVFFFTDPDPADGQVESGGFGLYRLDLAPDLSTTAGIRWTERNGVISRLDIILELMSLNAVSEEIDAPILAVEDWPEIPVIERTATGAIVTGAGIEIELYNAEPAQRELVEWAIERFEAAGLPAPTPRSVGFPPDLRCAVSAGVAIDTAEGVDLQLCVTADEVCEGDGCRPSAVARSTMLHELGHVWIKGNADEATRQEFMKFRGLTDWAGADVERDLQATEHAAEIMSWGLMDEESWGARLPESDCAVLAEAFEILTGHPPLRKCAAG